MRVAVLGAGGPAGNNVSRSLKEAGHAVVAVEGNPLHLPLAIGDTKLLVPPERDLSRWLNEVTEHLQVDVIHAQPDGMVEYLARYASRLSAKTLLPRIGTVLRCQDKFDSGIDWRRAGLRETRIIPIESPADILGAGLELGYPFWLRARHGAGARGASEIHSLAMGEAWLSYWFSRGVGWDFVAEEFLPGRDFAWTSLWYQGKLITAQARERLEYIYPYLAPSGRTGTPVVSVTISSQGVNTMAEEAVLAIDGEPHGLFCVDLREDAGGTPRPTEINVGRFFTTSYFYTAAGLNIPDMVARLAVGDDLWEVPEQYNPLPQGLYWVRHIDCGSHLCQMVDGTLVRVG